MCILAMKSNISSSNLHLSLPHFTCAQGIRRGRGGTSCPAAEENMPLAPCLAADVVARVVHIKPSSDDIKVVDWLLGRSRFQSRDLLRLAHRVSRAPVTDVVLCDLIASWARRPKNHGFTTNPRTRRQMN